MTNKNLKNYISDLVANFSRNIRKPQELTAFVVLCFCFYTVWFYYPKHGVYKEEKAKIAIPTNAEKLRLQVSKNETHSPKKLKYVLLWTTPNYFPFDSFGNGSKNLIKYNCSFSNCYFTSDKNFFGDNLTKFDAIAFNGRNLHKKSTFPKTRSPKQKYIFVNTESAENYPVCHEFYEGFFNWTATYKLDSDIVFSYFVIKNASGDIVGPKVDMKWDKLDEEIDEDVEKILQNKTKTGAWFVSNCQSKNKREYFVNELMIALSKFNETLHVYGLCGTRMCQRNESDRCFRMLQRDYFFYMSLENSFAEDYVTEKLLHALQNDVVPIVYGGANYSRFLPPGSYIDGRAISIKNLSSLIYNLERSPELYKEYFKWKRNYSYQDAGDSYGCSVCQALNNETLVETHSSYKRLKEWWNPPNGGNYCGRFIGY